MNLFYKAFLIVYTETPWRFIFFKCRFSVENRTGKERSFDGGSKKRGNIPTAGKCRDSFSPGQRPAQYISLRSFYRNEERSRLFVSAALRKDCSAPFRSAHRPSLVFRIWFVRRMTPLACRDTPEPAAAPAHSSHHTPHRVRRCGSPTLTRR